MKRTPPWVFIAAAGVMLAGLSLCVWAMERSVEAEEGSAEPPPPAPPDGSAQREALAPASETAPEPAAAPAREPEPVPAPQSPGATETAPERPVAESAPEPAPAAAPQPPPAARPEPRPEPWHEPVPGPAVVRAGAHVADRFDLTPGAFENVPPARFEAPFTDVPRPKPAPAVVRVQPSSPDSPMFGAPPARPREAPAENRGLPAFITELADATTQVVRGFADDGTFAFGFYADGNIRFADVDGGRYAGMAESARARMREIDGTRAFTVQIGVAADGRLQATFTGGPHDAETIALEPLIGWSAA
ncbi:MAG TPA: hypothetical protein VHT53_13545 [Candidatus Elarobacter sp.]|nr:hypothetical protein [Candidatus Elarobacter sp.]